MNRKSRICVSATPWVCPNVLAHQKIRKADKILYYHAGYQWSVADYKVWKSRKIFWYKWPATPHDSSISFMLCSSCRQTLTLPLLCSTNLAQGNIHTLLSPSPPRATDTRMCHTLLKTPPSAGKIIRYKCREQQAENLVPLEWNILAIARQDSHQLLLRSHK
jgi:hypothetical protein